MPGGGISIRLQRSLGSLLSKGFLRMRPTQLFMWPVRRVQTTGRPGVSGSIAKQLCYWATFHLSSLYVTQCTLLVSVTLSDNCKHISNDLLFVYI